MAAVANATPLIALDAIVIDTETTSVDPGKARIVEFAAVRMTVGKLDEQASFQRLVRPDEPIPAAATRIHGIDEVAVAGAPTFAQVWPECQREIGDSVLIGHSVGFDLAVIMRECKRIGVAWHPPISLDTRLLAQIAAPRLAGDSLEKLAAWLGVAMGRRHSALGDAETTARIFCALVPKLRDRGIRTLAEAIRETSKLTALLDTQHRAGWAESAPLQRETTNGGAASRIETYAYRHRAGDIMNSPPKLIRRGTTIGSALDTMARERISSLFVIDKIDNDPPLPHRIGIVTERDVLRALSECGASAIEMPVENVATFPLVTVPADSLAYLAIGRMNRLKIRHLGVTSASGHVIGALSARDLLKLRNQHAIELGDEIEQAKDVHELGLAWAKLTGVARDLCLEGVSAREVAAVISHQLGEATRRAAVLAEYSMKADGLGEPPCRYAFVVLGSAGRGESMLAMDQDNALVHEDTAEQAPQWFEALGVRVADILHEIGVPYCPGGVMARNPQWRGSLSSWRARVADWIQRSSPGNLLAVDIFFDMRGVHGEIGLADTLWRDAFDAARGQASFAKLLTDAAGPSPSGLNWFGGIRTEDGRIDLKKSGLFAIVSAARSLAICHHVTERSTPARLAGIKALGLGMEADLDALDEAQACFVDLILKQQIEDISSGRSPSNAVEIKRLSRRERMRLRTALRAIDHVDTVSRDLLFRS